jgi:sulfur carrier protein ThiS
MTVTVVAHSTIGDFIRRIAPSDTEFKYELEDGATLKMLARSLRIPSKEIGFYMVNGDIAKPDDVIKDGDKIEIFPMLEGG